MFKKKEKLFRKISNYLQTSSASLSRVQMAEVLTSTLNSFQGAWKVSN